MTSKSRDKLSRTEAARHYQDKKRRYNETIPYIRNLLDYTVTQLRDMKVDIHKDVKVIVTNLLDISSACETSIHSISGDVGREMVHSIYCPTCHKPISIHKLWNCYFCQDQSHGKMIFDVRYLKSEKLDFFERRVSELEAIALKIEFTPKSWQK